MVRRVHPQSRWFPKRTRRTQRIMLTAEKKAPGRSPAQAFRVSRMHSAPPETSWDTSEMSTPWVCSTATECVDWGGKVLGSHPSSATYWL